MPGLKRPSLEPEDDDEPTGSQEPNKRQRLSQTIELSDRDSDSSDEEVDLDEDAINEQVRQRESRPSRVAQNGIIESIYCINFMCHANLEVDLGPLVNFVIGQNGSGKSAVLTALTICLGGKASSTNRANTLKAFIKEGEDYCRLTVKIKNVDGYQPDVYGNVIQVERTFTRAGTSSFKIKNSNGRTVATTRAALDDILDWYAFAFDNPICVLSQDMARQFIANSTPSDKYKFFIKGVQLEQLNHDYELLAEYIDHIEAVHESRKTNLEELGKVMQETKRRLDMISQGDEMQERITLLGAQMCWAQVEEQERALEACEQQVRDAEASIQDTETEIEAKSAMYERANDAYTAAAEAAMIESAKISPIQAELPEAERQLAEANKEVSDAQGEERANKADQDRSTAKITNLADQISEEKRRLEEASGGTATARFESLERAKRTHADTQQQATAHSDRLPALNRKRADAEERTDNASGPVKAKETEISQAESQLRALRNDRHNDRDRFPHKMNDVLSSINGTAGFRQRPIGPIGKHIQLLEPKWSSVLEKTFGGVLNGFIVTCKDDRDKLSAIMRRHGVSFYINIINQAPRFDISSQEPSSEHTTAARVLRIDNDLVFNQLVISQRIEQLMLIENEQEAIELMSRGRIMNVSKCFTLDQTTAGLGHAYVWTSSGTDLSSTFVERYKGTPRMKTNLEDQVRMQEEYIVQLENELRTTQQTHRGFQTVLVGCDQEIVRHTRETEVLKRRLRDAQRDIDRIQGEIDSSTIEEGRLNTLQESLETAREQLQYEEEALQTSLLPNLEQQVESQRQRIGVVQEIKARLTDAEGVAEMAEDLKLRRESTRRDALKQKNDTYEKKKSALETRDRFVVKRETQVAIVQDYQTKAPRYFPRVAVPLNETWESLDKKQKKLEIELQKYERQAGGGKEQVSSEHLEAKSAYRSFRKIMDNEEDLLATMKQSLAERHIRWRRFRKFISARARFNFMQCLSERGFSGNLAINHDERRLEALIQPNETESTAAARQAKTLSGGEKSFSTICLILSLWEAICAPVRCLDEYDVFMDAANREISTKLLVTNAYQAQERQFIFITPQAMDSVTESGHLRLIRLKAPERGQQTLSFGITR